MRCAPVTGVYLRLQEAIGGWKVHVHQAALSPVGRLEGFGHNAAQLACLVYDEYAGAGNAHRLVGRYIVGPIAVASKIWVRPSEKVSQVGQAADLEDLRRAVDDLFLESSQRRFRIEKKRSFRQVEVALLQAFQIVTCGSRLAEMYFILNKSYTSAGAALNEVSVSVPVDFSLSFVHFHC